MYKITCINGCAMAVCSKCNKELSASEKLTCEKTDSSLCSECRYLESIGVVTIQDYNTWLRGEWRIK